MHVKLVTPLFVIYLLHVHAQNCRARQLLSHVLELNVSLCMHKKTGSDQEAHDINDKLQYRPGVPCYSACSTPFLTRSHQSAYK